MSDYISREALIGKVEKHYCAPCKGQGGDLDGDWCRSCVINSVLEKVRGIPAADVVPVAHGELTEHIHELLRAEQDGRLVVLPCRVGDRVYRIIDDGKLRRGYYSTREEAEKALEEVCKQNT